MFSAVTNKMMKAIGTKALQFGIRHSPEYFNAKVTELTVMATRKAVKDILTQERIAHCNFCFDRNELRKFGDKYLCKEHHQILMKEVNAKSAANDNGHKANLKVVI